MLASSPQVRLSLGNDAGFSTGGSRRGQTPRRWGTRSVCTGTCRGGRGPHSYKSSEPQGGSSSPASSGVGAAAGLRVVGQQPVMLRGLACRHRSGSRHVQRAGFCSAKSTKRQSSPGINIYQLLPGKCASPFITWGLTHCRAPQVAGTQLWDGVRDKSQQAVPPAGGRPVSEHRTSASWSASYLLSRPGKGHLCCRLRCFERRESLNPGRRARSPWFSRCRWAPHGTRT